MPLARTRGTAPASKVRPRVRFVEGKLSPAKFAWLMVSD
jgi:hypothetical protein